MRVLIVHNRYRSRTISGEDKVFDRETRDLQARLGKENVFTYSANNDGPRRWYHVFAVFWSLTHYRAVRRMVRDNGIDIVHIHNFFPSLSASVFFAAKAENAKVVHTLHNYRWWCIAGIFYTHGNICEICTRPGRFPWGVFRRCYRVSLPHSALATLAFRFYRAIGALATIDTFIVLTPFQHAKVASLGIPEEKLALKPNCVPATATGQESRDGFLFVGRLERSKGIEVLLRSWQEQSINYPLAVIGAGPRGAALRTRYGNDDRIHFLGQLPHHEVHRVMQASRFLVHPSLCYETFGLTIIEAMQRATPVIGFAIGTRNDFIRDGHNGFLTSPEQLAHTVERAATFGDYARMQDNARAFARQFDREYVLDAQIECYQALLP